MYKISIIGATGYTGQELVRLLWGHPQAEIIGLGSQTYCGQPFSSVYPSFRGIVDITCQAADDPLLLENSDIIFLALPHGHSAAKARTALALANGLLIWSDFRLKDVNTYSEWYKTEALQEELRMVMGFRRYIAGKSGKPGWLIRLLSYHNYSGLRPCSKRVLWILPCWLLTVSPGSAEQDRGLPDTPL